MVSAKLNAGAGMGELVFPEEYFPQEGYYGIHDKLYARALVLEASECMVLVTLDLPSIRPYELMDELRREIASLANTDFNHVWLSVVHDLAAPHVPKDQAGAPFRMHMDAVRNAIAAAVTAALKCMRPASVSAGCGTTGITSNRDIRFQNGWWVGINGSGPEDHTLNVMHITDESGRTIALVYNCPLKSCVMEDAKLEDGGKYVTGDLCGESSRLLEEKFGAPALFYMGAGGEQHPISKAHYLVPGEDGTPVEVNLGREGYDIISRLGAQLCSDVVTVVNHLMAPVPEPVLSLHHASVTVPGQVRFPRGRKPPVLYYDYPPAEAQEITLDALCIGNIAILAVKPEIMAAIYKEIRSGSPFRHTWLSALVNGGQDYIPTDYDYDRFEYPALHATVARGSDRLFIEKAKELLNSAFSG